MNKILLAILLLIILIISILIFKNTEKFSNCDRTKWIDDSCTTGGLCKPPDGDGSEWTCHDPNKNIVILFYTDWCLYSKNFMPIWDKISTQYTTDDDIKFIKINCDPDTSKCQGNTENDGSGINCSNGKKIYKDYNISQVPMVLFFPSNVESSNGIRFNLSINGIDSEADENEQSFDRFIKLNVSNFKT